jgi:hypothetical protein
VANKSKVERARRSIRVTVTTSPGVMSFSMRRSSRRSACAPLDILHAEPWDQVQEKRPIGFPFPSAPKECN